MATSQQRRRNVITDPAADPIQFARVLWPDTTFYAKQREIIYSVESNYETYVYAGNMLGKDYVAGFIALRAFLINPVCRVVTTSVKDDHLRVLWGEIGRFVDTCAIPLRYKQGGPLVVKHRELRKINGRSGLECKISYLLGMVSERGEGMAGHHAPYALGIIDEASGVDDQTSNQIDTWATRKLVFGNPNPCENFFRNAWRRGDVLLDDEVQLPKADDD